MGCSCTKGEPSESQNGRTTVDNPKHTSKNANKYKQQPNELDGSDEKRNLLSNETATGAAASAGATTALATTATGDNLKPDNTNEDPRSTSENVTSSIIDDQRPHGGGSKKRSKNTSFNKFKNLFVNTADKKNGNCVNTTSQSKKDPDDSVTDNNKAPTANQSQVNSDINKLAESNGIYSLNNLSSKTRSLFQGFLDADDGASNDLDKINTREIQLYISSPHTQSTIISKNLDLLALIDHRHNPYTPTSFTSSSSILNSSSTADKTLNLFAQLRLHAAKPGNNCDLNLIDLNENSKLADSHHGADDKLTPIHNKYFKRRLNQIILSDTLNLPKLRSSLNNYSSAYYMFVVFLSDTIIDEDDSNLLCPDQIDLDDYRKHVERSLNKDELALFNRLYKKQSDKQTLKLNIDYFNVDSSNYLANLLNDLNSMLITLKSRIDDDEAGMQFKLKYLKSLQQEEINLAINNVHESAIVWFHLTSNLSDHLDSSSDSSNCNLSFNQLRYKSVLNSLQSKVLAHNYKNISLSEPADNPREQLKLNEKTMNDFLYSSIKTVLDSYVNEINTNIVKSLATKIDKGLAEELNVHLDLCSRLSRLDVKYQQENRSKQQAFENKVNHYLNMKTKHPLILYHMISESHNKDHSDKVFLYELNTNELIAKWIKNNRKSYRFIVYRFCGHSVLSSQLVTVLQSVIHQLCYLLEVHESYAFDRPLNLIDNLFKALEHFKKERSLSSYQVLIILDRVDRLVETENDQLLLMSIIRKLYSSPLADSIKLVMTFKKSGHQASLSNLIDSLQSIFDGNNLNINEKISFNLNSKKASLASNSSACHVISGGDSVESAIKQHLKYLLSHNINSNNSQTTKNESIKFINENLVDALFQLLSQCRYGLKQSELIDLLLAYVSSTSHSSSSFGFHSNTNSSLSNHIHINYLIHMIWFTFKYYFRLTRPVKSGSLLDTLVDNNQYLYRLNKSPLAANSSIRSSTSSHIDTKHSSATKLASFLSNYYQSVFDKSTYNLSKSHRSLSSNFHLRAFLELPSLFKQLQSSDDPNKHQQGFASSFVYDPKWLLNKSSSFHSILYYLQDIEKFKSQFILNESNNHHNSNANTNANELDLENIDHEKSEFKIFEALFYKQLYQIHQDPYQIYTQFRLNLRILFKGNERLSTYAFIEKFTTNVVNEIEKKKSNLSLMIPLNYELLLDELKSYPDLSGNNHYEYLKKFHEIICFNESTMKHDYLSQLFFITSNCLVTISSTQNEIKLWQIDSHGSNDYNVKLIRSIKLNKSPKDMRLLNKYTAVVLLDRNLHIFDLNKCKHLLDLKLTMSTNVPYFEIHDEHHIVLLARNRLSIILKKVDLNHELDDENEMTAPSESTNSVAATSPPTETSASTKPDEKSDDSMFVFKVGEDRYLNSLLVSKNGQMMVCGDEVQKPFPLLVWNLKQRKLIHDLRQAKHEFNTGIQAISSSGRYVVCACQEEGESRNCLIVYDLSTGQQHKKIVYKFNFVSVEISEESGVIVAGVENGQLIVYDLMSGSKRFTINSNKYPANKIKIFDTNKHFKNCFLSYDTKGLDWTIRLWDLTKPDELISSFTCPSRIISCNVNLAPLYFNHKTQNNEDLLIGVALYGFRQPLIIKLTSLTSLNRRSSLIQAVDDHFGSHPHYGNDPSLNGIEVQIMDIK